MGTQVIRRYCRFCQTKRPFERESMNGVLHLLLILITAGLWLVILIPYAILASMRPFRCRACGKAALM